MIIIISDLGLHCFLEFLSREHGLILVHFVSSDLTDGVVRGTFYFASVYPYPLDFHIFRPFAGYNPRRKCRDTFIPYHTPMHHVIVCPLSTPPRTPPPSLLSKLLVREKNVFIFLQQCYGWRCALFPATKAELVSI